MQVWRIEVEDIAQDAARGPSKEAKTPKNLKKPLFFKGFLLCSLCTQMLPKWSPRAPQSLENRSQDAQDTAKMASWTSTWTPQGPKTTPKGDICPLLEPKIGPRWLQNPPKRLPRCHLQCNIVSNGLQDPTRPRFSSILEPSWGDLGL